MATGKFGLLFCDYPEAELRCNHWPLIHQATQGKVTERANWKEAGKKMRAQDWHVPAVATQGQKANPQSSIFCSPVTVTRTPQPHLSKVVQVPPGTRPGARKGLLWGPRGAAAVQAAGTRRRQVSTTLAQKGPRVSKPRATQAPGLSLGTYHAWHATKWRISDTFIQISCLPPVTIQ